jgi:hypothetical protein
MSLSPIRKLMLSLAAKKGSVICVSGEEANYFAQVSKTQALTSLICELQRKLPALQSVVASTSAAYVKAQLALRETVEKLETARSERDKILRRDSQKLLEAKQPCQLSEQN